VKLLALAWSANTKLRGEKQKVEAVRKRQREKENAKEDEMGSPQSKTSTHKTNKTNKPIQVNFEGNEERERERERKPRRKRGRGKKEEERTRTYKRGRGARSCHPMFSTPCPSSAARRPS
jgi:hypothetical protein